MESGLKNKQSFEIAGIWLSKKFHDCFKSNMFCFFLVNQCTIGIVLKCKVYWETFYDK